MHQGASVRGLGTAATFWAVSAIGLLAYAMAVALTVVVFYAHVILRSLPAWIERKAPPEERGPH